MLQLLFSGLSSGCVYPTNLLPTGVVITSNNHHRRLLPTDSFGPPNRRIPVMRTEPSFLSNQYCPTGPRWTPQKRKRLAIPTCQIWFLIVWTLPWTKWNPSSFKRPVGKRRPRSDFETYSIIVVGLSKANSDMRKLDFSSAQKDEECLCLDSITLAGLLSIQKAFAFLPLR